MRAMGFIFATVLLTGCSSYEDCVLENIGPGMSNHALEAVEDICEKKYPGEKVVLSRDEYDWLKARAPSAPAGRVSPENKQVDWSQFEPTDE